MKREFRSAVASILTVQERQLLASLGLSNPRTFGSCKKKIEKLRMRDLDRLKRVLTRVTLSAQIFPSSVKRGIKKNDLKAFAQAVFVLTNFEKRNEVLSSAIFVVEQRTNKKT